MSDVLKKHNALMERIVREREMDSRVPARLFLLRHVAELVAGDSTPRNWWRVDLFVGGAFVRMQTNLLKARINSWFGANSERIEGETEMRTLYLELSGLARAKRLDWFFAAGWVEAFGKIG